MNHADIIASLRTLTGGKSAACGGAVDDAEFAEILRRHGCLYLLSKLPPRESDGLELLANRLAVKHRYTACADIFAALENIPYAVIKGAALSQRIYGNTAYRISGDIDILVSPKDAEYVKSALTEKGFVQGRVADGEVVPYTRRELVFQKTFSHQLAAFVRQTGDKICPFANIDINTDIMWGESHNKTDMESFLSRAAGGEIEGVAIKRLPPEEEFISLCLHHYKDCNSIYLLTSRGLKLSHFCDIYYYLKNVPLDIPALKRKCDSLGVSDYVYYCVYHAHTLFGDDAVKPFIDTFRSESGEKLPNRFGLTPDEYHDWPKPFTECLFEGAPTEMLEPLLSPKEKEKIRLNETMM